MNQAIQSEGQTQNSPKKKWYKKRWVIVIAVLFVLFVIIGSSGEDQSQETSQSMEQVATQTEKSNAKAEEPKQEAQPQESEVQQETKIPKYEIVYELKGKRYDGGVNYYVLIDPVNLTNDNFKNDIKNITRQIVKDKGSKISVDFVDNKEVLDLEYKSHYGANTLGRILTQAEMEQLGFHLIAAFSGEVEIDEPQNSLLFFPATFKDNPKVGKYVESIEFNPN